MDVRTVPVVDLADQVRRRQLSAREVVGHARARIEADSPTLNAFVAVDGGRALAAGWLTLTNVCNLRTHAAIRGAPAFDAVPLAPFGQVV